MSKKSIFTIMMIAAAGMISGQEADIEIDRGIQAFYQAEFEQSIQILQNVLNRDTLEKSDLFRIHLYIAFSKYRLGYLVENITMHLRLAAQARPDTVLDSAKFPPDLTDRYDSVRGETVGSLLVTSHPDSASIVLLDLETHEIEEHVTPYRLYGIERKRYSIVVSKQGWKAFTGAATLQPSKSEILNVTLKASKPAVLKKYWPYGAGILVAGVLVLAQFVDTDSDNEKKSLPLPPDRP
ncbi:MAG: hypothetical protein U5R06_05940 [candidate division KSB1 bacterium]|nr:hypothetical protein [candidate division KSB1 bacterium]